jgi:PBP1b-binding outer membrane lipoprotein LpoB
MKLIKTTIIILFSTLVISSCKKLIENNTPNNVSELLNQLKDEPQIFNVQAGTFQDIIGAKGTRIHFNPSSFKNNNGDVITSGTVKIELIETPKASDMLLNQVSTLTTNNLMLESGGSFNMKASQNGETLKAGTYGADFKQPANNTNSMQLFTGETNNGVTQWNPVIPDNQVNASQDSLDYYFIFDSVANFNWINCDRFRNDPAPKTDIFANLKGVDFKLSEAYVFVVLPTINGNMIMNPSSLNPNNFDINYNKLPIGLNFHLIAVGVHKNKYYYGVVKNRTVSADLTTEINMVEKTKDEIKAAVRTL